MEHHFLGVASILILGIGAQWLAWRLRIPSILLLLVCGFIAGPVTGFLDPDALFGRDVLFPFVSISVGIILFEGGLSLRLRELREIGVPVRNLISIGAMVTWVLAAAFAYLLTDFNLYMAIIAGSILVVTGPTVVGPLLMHIRPTGRIGTIAKWEGITIDPVGAILAILVLEVVLSIKGAQEALIGNALLHALEALFLTTFLGLGIAVAGAFLLVVLLQRRLVPDYLQNSVVLLIVVGAFTLSEVLQEETGLLTTTLMGIAMANQRYVPVRRIVEFKEDLRVLLIGALFILLSARLDLADLAYLNLGTVLFLAALMFVVRPAAVYLSAFGTQLSWQERAFLSWLAPRGIVAAAVASLFSFRLIEYFPDEAGGLAPIIFMIIIGTVAIYGLTLMPIARRLGLAHPNPQGILFAGAPPWIQDIALELRKQKIKVLLVDTNPENVARAHNLDLPIEQANILAEGVMEELDLGGIGRLLAVTPNDEVNALAILHFSEIFDSSGIYQILNHAPREGEPLPQYLRGRPLFKKITYQMLAGRHHTGAELRVLQFEDGYDENILRTRLGEHAIPLFLCDEPGQVYVFTEDEAPNPAPGQSVIAMVHPAELPPETDAPASEAPPEPDAAPENPDDHPSA